MVQTVFLLLMCLVASAFRVLAERPRTRFLIAAESKGNEAPVVTANPWLKLIPNQDKHESPSDTHRR